MKKSLRYLTQLCLPVAFFTLCLHYLLKNTTEGTCTYNLDFNQQNEHLIDVANKSDTVKSIDIKNETFKVINVTITSNSPENKHTTCRESVHQGIHQKVIAFSLYGPFDDPQHYARYGTTFKSTVEQININYPDWLIRVYHNYKSIEESNYLKLQNLVEGFTNVDFCNAMKVLEERGLNMKTFEMNWRFLPLLDPAVDFFMSRDADCHIFQREVDAVNHWLQEPKNSTFHIMRDHPLHEIEMLGGLWGAKVHQKRGDIETAITKMLKRKPQNGKGMDQLLLGMYVWPLALHDMVAHDSYLCYKYPNTHPFPTRRQGDQFIGMIVNGNVPIGKAEICPEKCRPLHHKDWIFC